MAQHQLKAHPHDSHQGPRRLYALRTLLFRYSMAPSLILAVLLCLVFTFQQMNDRRELLLDHGRASAEQLVALIQLSDGEPLEARLAWLNRSLMVLMLEKDMIRSIQLYRSEVSPETQQEEFKLLSSVGPRPRTRFSAADLRDKPAHIYEDVHSLQVLQPLLGKDTNCWLTIELHRPYFVVGTYQVALVGLIGLIICTFVALIWAVFLSEHVSKSLARYSDALRSIGRGHFNTRPADSRNLELYQLGEHINAMAENLSEHQREHQENLHQSMEDLRQSLDSMEEQNIELDLARKKALENSRVKSTFLANTSHEIRTPLNGIIGFTNLLLKTDVDELQHDYLQTILRSSENLLTTINDILDFSRIESGNLVLDHIPMNLGQVLEETLQILAPYAHEHNLELVPLIDPELPPTLVGDPLRIKQVLTNLVSNAIRCSEKGNIPVRVNVQSGKESEMLIRVSITDIGNRIDEQARRELQQLVSSKNLHQSQQLTSNGMGLAIARRLIETMHGNMGLDETTGGGAIFWFHIPLILDRGRSASNREQFPGCRLLLADPNRMTRLQISQLLKHWQAEPVELSDSKTLQPSLEQMWRHDSLPDAVIIDTAMAEGNFEQFIGIVQQLVDTYQCRVIIQGSPLELRRCYEQLRTRVLAFLGKPVSRDGLLRALKRAAPHQTAARPITGMQPALPWSARPRVLAVDDYEANRHLVSELLRAQNIDAVVASSGEEALQLWREQQFDIIFMDIQMPQLDGIETTRCIRAEETGKRIPIVALTAHVGTEEKARLLSAGLDDYLSKPISEAQLSSTIQRWMKILTLDSEQPKPQPSRSRLVDIGESLNLSNNDSRLARDLLRMLVKGLLEDEQELNRLYEAGDHKGLFELTHRIHGGCCYCGVPRLRNATGKLQEELRPQQEQLEAVISGHSLQAVISEIRALRDWAAEQDLDALFGLETEAAS